MQGRGQCGDPGPPCVAVRALLRSGPSSRGDGCEQQGKPTPATPWLAELLARHPSSWPPSGLRAHLGAGRSLSGVPFFKTPGYPRGLWLCTWERQAWGAGTGFMGTQANSRGKEAVFTTCLKVPSTGRGQLRACSLWDGAGQPWDVYAHTQAQCKV